MLAENKYQDNLPFGLELIDDRTVRKTAQLGSYRDHPSLIMIENIVNHFIKNPDPMVVPVYNFRRSNRHQAEYSYDMKRLLSLAGDEKDVIREIFAQEKLKKLKPHLFFQGLDNPFIAMGKERFPDLVEFIYTVLRQGRYTDLHSGNFLKDEQENYLIVDLEGFITYPLSSLKNSWIPAYNKLFKI